VIRSVLSKQQFDVIMTLKPKLLVTHIPQRYGFSEGDWSNWSNFERTPSYLTHTSRLYGFSPVCVRWYVFNQIVVLRKRLIAHVTIVRVFTDMHPLVHRQYAIIDKLLIVAHTSHGYDFYIRAQTRVYCQLASSDNPRIT